MKKQLFKKFENEMREWNRQEFVETAKFMEENKGICEGFCQECPFSHHNSNIEERHCVTAGYCSNVAIDDLSEQAEQSAKAFLEYVEMKKWKKNEEKIMEKDFRIEIVTRKEIFAKFDDIDIHLDTYTDSFSLFQDEKTIACDFDELYEIMTKIKEEKEKK